MVKKIYDKKTAIVLFSDDFRIEDNPALYNACMENENIIPLYVYKEDYLGRSLGLASKVFLHEVLISFQNLLKTEYNINLIIKQGDAVDVIQKISNQMQIDGIYFNRSYTAVQIQEENEIKSKFQNLEVKSFKAKVIFEPWEIKPASGGEFYRVFTPFSKECLKNLHLINPTFPKPTNIESIHNIESLDLKDLNLIPSNQGNWFKKMLSFWNFSYEQIENNFAQFLIDKIQNYKRDRDIPSKNGTSRISPYLRFGMLSPKICFNAARKAFNGAENQFVSEILWREFSYHVFFYNQTMATEEVKKEYGNFAWEHSPTFFKKWKKGETGFSIVDAGMKELWETGSLHGRVRMITASFLIKDLLIDWKLGERWFWDTLVDADVAVNPFSWQWVFGSGFDSAPYFRIFNPFSQKEKFDLENHYCEKWLPQNWQSLEIVNHDIQRKKTLLKYQNL
jgi:deoxyribodipyrimidine photo-lyase